MRKMLLLLPNLRVQWVWLHDPSIKDIAKQIEKDPSFNKMAEQFRQTFHGGDDGVPQFDIKQQYFSTTEQQFMQNPQLMKMAKSLGTVIMQDPSMSQMLESLSNPAQKEQLEERMTRIKEDPSLKPILEEIESGGPTAMMRYWNDEDVLKKVGEAMGLAVTEDATASAGHPVADGRKR
ncbi:putative STI1 domain-containing protein [Helianthus debilis subsp. tardiflorus]